MHKFFQGRAGDAVFVSWAVALAMRRQQNRAQVGRGNPTNFKADFVELHRGGVSGRNRTLSLKRRQMRWDYRQPAQLVSQRRPASIQT